MKRIITLLLAAAMLVMLAGTALAARPADPVYANGKVIITVAPSEKVYDITIKGEGDYAIFPGETGGSYSVSEKESYTVVIRDYSTGETYTYTVPGVVAEPTDPTDPEETDPSNLNPPTPPKPNPSNPNPPATPANRCRSLELPPMIWRRKNSVST